MGTCMNDRHGLDASIGASSWHYPGNTIRVEYRKATPQQ